MFSISMGNFLITQITHYNSIPVSIVTTQSDSTTTFTVDANYTPVYHEKIEFEDGSGIYVTRQNTKTNKLDTIPLSGTFLVSKLQADKQSFTIEDNNWKTVKTIKKSDITSGYQVVFHRYKHQAYFYMYAVLMFIAAVLFIGVAVNYKGKTYIQGDAE
jgi:hypothetical protein